MKEDNGKSAELQQEILALKEKHAVELEQRKKGAAKVGNNKYTFLCIDFEIPSEYFWNF